MSDVQGKYFEQSVSIDFFAILCLYPCLIFYNMYFFLRVCVHEWSCIFVS